MVKKQEALSAMIVLDWPNGCKIYSSTNFMTVSEVASFSAFSSSQFVRCMRQINTYWKPFYDFGNGPAKSIEKKSKRFVNRRLRLV